MTAPSLTDPNNNNNQRTELNMDTITINGVNYAPISEIPPRPAVRIVILQRGWVFVGRFTQDGDDCVLTDASSIRRWGTTKGLGELVNGPLKDTVLDKAGTVRFHALGVVATIDANEDAWSAKL